MIFSSKAKAEAQRQKMIVYRRVFGTPEGREVLTDLMNENYILNSHGGDPLKEGARLAVLNILKLVNFDVNEFDKLTKGESVHDSVG